MTALVDYGVLFNDKTDDLMPALSTDMSTVFLIGFLRGRHARDHPAQPDADVQLLRPDVPGQPRHGPAAHRRAADQRPARRSPALRARHRQPHRQGRIGCRDHRQHRRRPGGRHRHLRLAEGRADPHRHPAPVLLLRRPHRRVHARAGRQGGHPCGEVRRQHRRRPDDPRQSRLRQRGEGGACTGCAARPRPPTEACSPWSIPTAWSSGTPPSAPPTPATTSASRSPMAAPELRGRRWLRRHRECRGRHGQRQPDLRSAAGGAQRAPGPRLRLRPRHHGAGRPRLARDPILEAPDPRFDLGDAGGLCGPAPIASRARWRRAAR